MIELLLNNSILTKTPNQYYKTVILLSLNNCFKTLKIDEVTNYIDINEPIEINIVDFDPIDIDEPIKIAAIAFDLIGIDRSIEMNTNCKIRFRNNSFDYNFIFINF